MPAEAGEKEVYGFKPCMRDKPQRSLGLRTICHKPQDLSQHCLPHVNIYYLLITFLFNGPFVYVSIRIPFFGHAQNEEFEPFEPTGTI